MNLRNTIGVSISIAAGIALAWWGWLGPRWPMDTLEKATLGMKEVDLTLVYGYQPNLMHLSQNKTHKVLTFGVANTGEYTFRRESGSYVLVRICSDYFTPFKQQFSPAWARDFYVVNSDASESWLLQRLGEPSAVSVNEDGTKKMLSFGFSNVAFELKGGEVIKSCVTRDLPIRYSSEYASIDLLPSVAAQ